MLIVRQAQGHPLVSIIVYHYNKVCKLYQREVVCSKYIKLWNIFLLQLSIGTFYIVAVSLIYNIRCLVYRLVK